MHHLKRSTSVFALTAAVAALTLAGCNQNSPQKTAVLDQPPPLPLTTTDVPMANAAPIATALPAAPAARVASVALNQRYAYADRAYQVARVLGDAPPDYAFDYEGTRPWVWRSSRAFRVVERTDAGQRYYYFDPGQSSPYLVQDPAYSYGYSNGQLVVVYDAQGRTLDPSLIGQRADLAGRYLYRARSLYNAALSSQRQAVAVARWQERRAAIDADRARWEAQQNQYADWRAYHDEHEAEQQSYWQGEQDRRAAEASRYNEALGGAYTDGRYDQRAQDNGGKGVALAAALAAAAAAYTVGRHHDDNARDRGPPPPPQQGGPFDRGGRGPEGRPNVGPNGGPGPTAGPQGPGRDFGGRGPTGQDARAQPQQQADEQRQQQDAARQADQQRQAADTGRRRQDQQRAQPQAAPQPPQRQPQDAARRPADPQRQAAEQQRAQPPAAPQPQRVQAQAAPPAQHAGPHGPPPAAGPQPGPAPQAAKPPAPQGGGKPGDQRTPEERKADRQNNH
jgi:hypothetical protein